MPRSQRQELQRVALSAAKHLDTALTRIAQLHAALSEHHPDDAEVVQLMGFGILSILTTLADLWEKWWYVLPPELIEYKAEADDGTDNGNGDDLQR